MEIKNDVTVVLPTGVWAALVEYEPYQRGRGLDTGARRQLATATHVFGGPSADDAHVVTLTGYQADALEVWLLSLEPRDDAPPEVAAAIEKVREAKLLAQ